MLARKDVKKRSPIDRNLIEDVSLLPSFFSCGTKSGVLGWGGGGQETKVCTFLQALARVAAWMETLMLVWTRGRGRVPQMKVEWMVLGF